MPYTRQGAPVFQFGFQIPERYVPVMLLAVGYATVGNWALKRALR